MKILLSWLKDYTDIKLSDKELVDKLNITGTEVEAVESDFDENVIVAEIKAIKKHPNADRLRIAEIYDGKENLTVVCGAPNIEIGQKVPLARIGARLGDTTLEKAVIRGVESNGMLCAQDELGLGEDHNGIIILPSEYEIGKPLKDYIQTGTVLTLEITPNRGDCLSHVGIAREVAAFSGNTIKKEPISLKRSPRHIKDKLSVRIEEKNICQQYMARVIEGVKIKPSPEWLQKRLIAVGLKPINNVVDVTNYIMMDLGQPLHAFDENKLNGKEIIVRKGKEKETLTTLDGKKYDVSGAILITDAKKPIGLAGIIGGGNSEIDDKTTTVVLESAEFNRKIIRKTTKTLGIVTDASYRFERGIDSGSVEYALNKAAKLIEETACGQVLEGIVKAGEKPVNQTLDIPHEKINKLTGLNLLPNEIDRYLKSLGFEVKDGNCAVPLWRHDIEVWQDLAEEVARMYGYNKIKPVALENVNPPKKSDYYKKEFIKDRLVDLGLTEVINYPYFSESDVQLTGAKASTLLEIKNPMQPETKFLRNSLIPGLLKSIAKNPSFDQIFIFEIGKVFSKKEEKTYLGIAIAGKGAKEKANNIGSELSNILNVKNLKIDPVDSEMLGAYKIKKLIVFAFELDLTGVKIKSEELDNPLKIPKNSIVYRPVSKYPSVTRDLAFIIDRAIKSSEVEKDIYEVSDLINRVELFDEFASDKFGQGKKNIAFHIYLQRMERTMTDQEADEVMHSVIKSIEKKFSAKLRS